MNFLNERTLKGTFYGNYKPRTDLPAVVEKYMNKVTSTWIPKAELFAHIKSVHIIDEALFFANLNRDFGPEMKLARNFEYDVSYDTLPCEMRASLHKIEFYCM